MGNFYGQQKNVAKILFILQKGIDIGVRLWYNIDSSKERRANDSGEEKEKAEQSQDSGNLTASFDRLNRRNAVNTYRQSDRLTA